MGGCQGLGCVKAYSTKASSSLLDAFIGGVAGLFLRFHFAAAHDPPKSTASVPMESYESTLVELDGEKGLELTQCEPTCLPAIVYT